MKKQLILAKNLSLNTDLPQCDLPENVLTKAINFVSYMGRLVNTKSASNWKALPVPSLPIINPLFFTVAHPPYTICPSPLPLTCPPTSAELLYVIDTIYNNDENYAGFYQYNLYSRLLPVGTYYELWGVRQPYAETVRYALYDDVNSNYILTVTGIASATLDFTTGVFSNQTALDFVTPNSLPIPSISTRVPVAVTNDNSSKIFFVVTQDTDAGLYSVDKTTGVIVELAEITPFALYLTPDASTLYAMLSSTEYKKIDTSTLAITDISSGIATIEIDYYGYFASSTELRFFGYNYTTSKFCVVSLNLVTDTFSNLGDITPLDDYDSIFYTVFPDESFKILVRDNTEFVVNSSSFSIYAQNDYSLATPLETFTIDGTIHWSSEVVSGCKTSANRNIVFYYVFED